MKKLVSVLLACLLLTVTAAPVFADLGDPEFENWFVVCGMAGFDFEDEIVDYEKGTVTPLNDHIEPGTKLQVFLFDKEDNKYLLVISDPNHVTQGTGFVHVTETQLNNDFIALNKTVDAKTGAKLEKSVTAKVTPKVGVVLRQGPATTFPKYTTVPQNTQLTYEYTYAYGGYHWAYVTYKGQSGWACTDYMETTGDAAATTPATQTTAAPSTETTAAQATETTAAGSASGEGQNAGEGQNGAGQNAESQTQKEEEKNFLSGLSQTKMIILCCCVAAIVLSLIGLVLLLAMRKKKN